MWTIAIGIVLGCLILAVLPLILGFIWITILGIGYFILGIVGALLGLIKDIKNEKTNNTKRSTE